MEKKKTERAERGVAVQIFEQDVVQLTNFYIKIIINSLKPIQRSSVDSSLGLQGFCGGGGGYVAQPATFHSAWMG
jgi:hypothetical protein